LWPIPAVTSTSSVRQLSGEKLPIKFSGEVDPGNIVSLTWARHFALGEHFVGVTDVSNAAAATPAPDGEPRSAREFILDHFADTADAGPQSIAQLVEATGVDRNTIDQALHRMIAGNEIVRVDRGLYKLAPKPTARVRNGHTDAEWIDLVLKWQKTREWNVERDGDPPDSPFHLIPDDIVRGLKMRQEREAKQREVQKAATPPPLAVSEADVELFTALLKAVNGRVAVGHAPGTGIADLRVPKAMIANGTSLEADILPTLRRHAGELAQRPLESWTARWFVEEVEAAHRRRLAAAQKAAQPVTVDDADLIDRLMAAAGNNVLTGGVHDVAPIRAMLADGVLLDDVLRVLRDKVNRGVSKYAATLESWSEKRFLKHCATAHLARTVVPALVERWLKTPPGKPAETPAAPAAVQAP
jgi:hypothetical protein